MKKFKLQTAALILLFLIMTTMYCITVVDLAYEIQNNQDLRDSLNVKEQQIEKYEYEIQQDSLKYAQKFDYVKKSMKKYNPEIKDSTVHLFLDVVKMFDLDSTEFLFNVCISQILKESGAQHRYSSRYGNRAGTLVISPANAIGIAQIQGPTAYHYLHRAIDNKEAKMLLDLGCDDFSFAKGNNTSKNIRKAAEWLKKENNNLILWGYIMKEIINKRDGDITEALVCYNAGIGNLLKMLENNVNLNNFSYVRNIYYLSNKRMKS